MDNNMDVSIVESGKYKDRMNNFLDLKPNDEKVMKGLNEDYEYELKNEVIQNRAKNFSAMKLTNEEINEKIFNKGILTAEEALEVNLIDGIMTYNEVMRDKFHGLKT